MIRFLVGFARRKGFTDDKIAEIDLMTEEILVNIVNYAYPKKKGYMEIECLTDTISRLVIRIVDQGVSFNPLLQPPPVLTVDVDKRQVGGLGIFFVKEFADEVHYAREGSNNVLTIIIGR